jgi:hypothetical protein
MHICAPFGLRARTIKAGFVAHNVLVTLVAVNPSLCMQDVPSFLQEVATVRGQLAYASQALRAKSHVPATLDVTDDVAMASAQLLVPLDQLQQPSLRAQPAPWADSCDFTKVGKAGRCGKGVFAIVLLQHALAFASAAPVAQHAQHGLLGCAGNNHPEPRAAEVDPTTLSRRSAPGDGAIVPKRESYAWRFAPMLARTLALQRKLLLRDPALSSARLIQSVVIGLVVGGLWYNLDVSARNSRCLP